MLNTGANDDYASLMPDLSEDADIQDAIKAYHYGTVDPTSVDSSAFASPSGFGDPDYGIVGKFKWVKTEIDAIKGSGATGAVFNSIVDAKGDLVVGTADNTPAKMGAGTNGYVLQVDTSNVTYGLKWANLDDTHLNLSGGTLVGNLSVTRASGNALLGLEAVSGSTKGINLKTGSSMRWEILSNSTAESSTATGSDLVVNRYNNSGTLLGTAVTITRSSGNVAIAGNLTVSAVTSGAWTGTAIAGQYGGTGVANTGKTITLGGSLTTSGAYDVTLTATGTTSVTLPTTGTLAVTASPTFTGTVTLPSTTSIGSVSSTELGYLDGVTSAVQTQINGKASSSATLTLGSTTLTLGGTTTSVSGLTLPSPTLTGTASAASITATGTVIAQKGIKSYASCYVTKSATQSISNNTETKVQCDVEDYDPGANYTSYVFNVDESGIYYVFGSVTFNTTGVAGTMYVRKTSLTGTVLTLAPLGNWFATTTGSNYGIAYIAGGDTVQLDVIQVSGSSKTLSDATLTVARIG